MNLLDPRNDESLNPFIDDVASVFGREHNMVVAEEDRVGSMTIDSRHRLSILRRRRRKRQGKLRGSHAAHDLTVGELWAWNKKKRLHVSFLIAAMKYVVEL